MSPRANVDQLARELASMSREELKPRILGFKSRTRLDFTPGFLDSLTTEQLRHILLAAMVCLDR
jgi:hypothetical protein